MGGLARVAKMYGGIKINGTQFVWDYVADCAVPESEMPLGSERHKASELKRWTEGRDPPSRRGGEVDRG